MKRTSLTFRQGKSVTCNKIVSMIDVHLSLPLLCRQRKNRSQWLHSQWSKTLLLSWLRVDQYSQSKCLRPSLGRASMGLIRRLNDQRLPKGHGRLWRLKSLLMGRACWQNIVKALQTAVIKGSHHEEKICHALSSPLDKVVRTPQILWSFITRLKLILAQSIEMKSLQLTLKCQFLALSSSWRSDKHLAQYVKGHCLVLTF